MHALTQVLSDPLAAGFGCAGLLCQLLWPVFRARRTMLAAQLGAGLDYALHYLLLDAWTGALICLVGATQTGVAIVATPRQRALLAVTAFLPAGALVTALTWSGAASAFALGALALTMTGRLQTDTLRMRVLLLAAAPLSMAHDVAVGSFPALCGGMIAASVASTMLLRELRLRRSSCTPAHA